MCPRRAPVISGLLIYLHRLPSSARLNALLIEAPHPHSAWCATLLCCLLPYPSSSPYTNLLIAVLTDAPSFLHKGLSGHLCHRHGVRERPHTGKYNVTAFVTDRFSIGSWPTDVPHVLTTSHRWRSRRPRRHLSSSAAPVQPPRQRLLRAPHLRCPSPSSHSLNRRLRCPQPTPRFRSLRDPPAAHRHQRWEARRSWASSPPWACVQ